MKIIQEDNAFCKDEYFILALHSTTDKLGIGVIHLNKGKSQFKVSTFNAGKDLSNNLFKYIEELLPSEYWPKIKRLAVATGPGGFTGTRITLLLARTMAQQLNCPLDGISAFELMAYRLIEKYKFKKSIKSFWITQTLKRHGTVGGQYEIIKDAQGKNKMKIKELIKPSLLPENFEISPSLIAKEDIEEDINRLLIISLDFYKRNIFSKWEKVLPIYPVSPVSK